MPALQGRAAWAEERLLGALRQSVPQNGHVHLHIIDKRVRQDQGKTKHQGKEDQGLRKY